jgi:hypothetical protein
MRGPAAAGDQQASSGGHPGMADRRPWDSCAALSAGDVELRSGRR